MLPFSSTSRFLNGSTTDKSSKHFIITFEYSKVQGSNVNVNYQLYIAILTALVPVLIKGYYLSIWNICKTEPETKLFCIDFSHAMTQSPTVIKKIPRQNFYQGINCARNQNNDLG